MVSDQTVSPQWGRCLCGHGRHAVDTNRLHVQNAAGCRGLSVAAKSQKESTRPTSQEGEAVTLSTNHRPTNKKRMGKDPGEYPRQESLPPTSRRPQNKSPATMPGAGQWQTPSATSSSSSAARIHNAGKEKGHNEQRPCHCGFTVRCGCGTSRPTEANPAGPSCHGTKENAPRRSSMR